MKICIMYTGLNRTSKETKMVYDRFLKDNINEFTVCFTTWDYEDTINFEEYFTDSKVFKFPDLEEKEIKEWIGRSHIEYSGGKTHNLVKQWYIRYKSIEVLDSLKKEFDVVVLTRTDVKIWKNISEYYNLINDDGNTVCTAIGPTWDLESSGGGHHTLSNNLYYGLGAVPTPLYFSNEKTMRKLLEIYNNKNLVSNGPYGLHDESSVARWINHLKLNRKVCAFDCFVNRPGTVGELIGQTYKLQPNSFEW